MKIKHRELTAEIEINSSGVTLMTGTRRVIALDGVLVDGAEKIIESPIYTREQILAMTIAGLDEVESSMENIEGYYALTLKADKQQAILSALGL